jgi:hypothetical protein
MSPPETYDSREKSGALSEPIEFYDFFRNDGGGETHWRYVASQETLSFLGDLYGALPGLSRSDIQQTGETTSMQVTVTVPRDAEVALAVRGLCSTGAVQLVIWRAQRGLTDDLAKEIFRGEITDPVFEGSMAALTCSSEESAWGDALCRVAYSRTCPYMLYDVLCSADAEAASFAGAITAISTDGLTVTVDEVGSPVDHLGADSLFYQTGCIVRGADRAFVTKQLLHVLTLQTPLEGALVGDPVQLVGGCDRTTLGCISHNNIERFGGFTKIPVISPWAGLA